jgi:hypothetical protein
MVETPKNRDELLMELSDGMNERTGEFAERFIERIEVLGLRLVPTEPTEGMVEAAALVQFEAFAEGSFKPRSIVRAAIAASPFAPEKTNG